MRAVAAPTLILQGTHDRVVLFPLALAQRDGIANSKLVMFEGSGHFLFLDEMDKFNREVAQFAK